MVTRTVNLTEEADAALENEAKANGTSVDEALEALLRRQDAFRRAVQDGIDDVAAGHVVEGDAVKSWLATWGTDDERDPPTCD